MEPMEPKEMVEAAAETGNLWYAHGLRFKCAGCGHCCGGFPGYVWVWQADMERIAAHLGLGLDDFTRKYVRQVGKGYSLTEKRDYDCVFLERVGGQTQCRIYEVRPTQCRTWPFWNLNLKSPEAWSAAAESCPGMCDGEAEWHLLEEIEKRRTEPGSP